MQRFASRRCSPSCSATLAAGALALAIGLRATSLVAPLGGLLAAAIIWYSPVRDMKTLESPPS